MCKHDWKPIARWAGRYRCDKCGAIGYRGIVTAEHHESDAMTSSIIPYKCQKTGCAAPAIQVRSRCPRTGKKKTIRRCGPHMERA